MFVCRRVGPNSEVLSLENQKLSSASVPARPVASLIDDSSPR